MPGARPYTCKHCAETAQGQQKLCNVCVLCQRQDLPTRLLHLCAVYIITGTWKGQTGKVASSLFGTG